MTYYYSPDDELSQGDIIRHVKVVINVNDAENNLPSYNESQIVVISRNCEISKPSVITTRTNLVLVAILSSVSSAPVGLQGYLRKNRVVSASYLPRQEKLMEEDCYIDWRTLQAVDKDNLYSLRTQADSYRCTLEKEQFIGSPSFEGKLVNMQGDPCGLPACSPVSPQRMESLFILCIDGLFIFITKPD